MTSKLPTPLDDETLVAYLDGELAGDDVAIVDQNLASNPSLRERMDRLRMTWDLLSELPDIQPQRDLTQTTIAMVALAVKEDKQAGASWLLANRWVWLAVTAFALFGSGAWLASVRAAAQTEQILNDLPILDHYADLTQFESSEWLEKLMSVENLVKATNGKSEANQPAPLPLENQQRLEWLGEIPASRKLRLAANQQAYVNEPPKRRDDFQKMAELLTHGSSQHSAAAFQTVLRAYTTILDRIGTTEKMHLRAEKDLDAWAVAVSRLVHRELAMAHAKKLSTEDRWEIRSWINEWQADYAIYSRSPSRDPDTLVVLEVYKDPSESFITNEELEILEEKLSDTAVKLLAGLDERQQRDVLGLWLVHVVESTRTSPQAATADELSKRFNTLSLDAQAEIEFLNERDARTRLSNLNTSIND